MTNSFASDLFTFKPFPTQKLLSARNSEVSAFRISLSINSQGPVFHMHNKYDTEQTDTLTHLCLSAS